MEYIPTSAQSQFIFHYIFRYTLGIITIKSFILGPSDSQKYFDVPSNVVVL